MFKPFQFSPLFHFRMREKKKSRGFSFLSFLYLGPRWKRTLQFTATFCHLSNSSGRDNANISTHMFGKLRVAKLLTGENETAGEQFRSQVLLASLGFG